MPLPRVKSWYSTNCVDCNWPLITTPQGRKQRCESCAIKSKKEKEKERQRHSDFGPAREFTLVCGHKLYFRMAPRSGEHLFCARCDDWIMYYIPGARQASIYDLAERCRNGHDRATHSRKDTQGRWVCRKCHSLKKREKRQKLDESLGRLGMKA